MDNKAIMSASSDVTAAPGKLLTAFVVMHKTDETIPQLTDNFTFLDMPGDWKLAYLNKDKFDVADVAFTEFQVLYTKKAQDAFGYIDSELEVVTRDKCNRFYVNPTTAHFCGLMLDWSTVGIDGGTYSDNDGLNWTPVDDECWHGDIDSVILNLVMPKDGGGACGCGDNAGAVVALGRFIDTQRNHPIIVTEEARKAALDSTTYDKGLLGNAMLFIGYIVDAAGFTEHGGSVYHGWLQLKGVYLAFLIAESIAETARVNAE